MARILVVCGLSGSGPLHWQTKLEQLDARAKRVEQQNWDEPELSAWCASLDAAVRESDEPAVVVAHSLGCVLVAHWAQRSYDPRVRGAVLVAPADVDSPACVPPSVAGFAPLPRAKLQFASVVIASRDDPFMHFSRAEELAADWGAQFYDAGFQGHLNAESNLGTFPLARQHLRRLLRDTPFSLDPRLAADCMVFAQSPLCLLLIMNDRRYPWLILVPKRSGIEEAIELDEEELATLHAESDFVSRALSSEFAGDKINVAAIGNVVRQLHVHHVVRTLGDPAWPGPVWGHSPRVPHDTESLAELTRRLWRSSLAEHFFPVP